MSHVSIPELKEIVFRVDPFAFQMVVDEGAHCRIRLLQKLDLVLHVVLVALVPQRLPVLRLIVLLANSFPALLL